MKSSTINQILLLIVFIITQGIQAQNIQTIQLRPGPQDGYDCDIRNDDLTPNWLSDDFMANAWTVNGGSFIQRGLLKFDLSQIPTGSEIVSARLSLFCNTMSGHHQLQAGANACYLKRVVQSWDQTTTNWSNQPATTNENAKLLERSQSSIQDYPNIDVTDFVTYWYSNPNQNFGLSIQLVQEIMYSCMVFGSSNHINELKRPLLVIEYTNCSLPLNEFSYIEDGLECQFNYVDSTTTEWHWNFGDGSSSELQSPAHSYQSAGTYIVRLTAINPCGRTTMQDTIILCRKPASEFRYRINGQTVSFTCITENVDNWYWSFGNGFFSNLENPVYAYLEKGNYQVCLMVSNSCGSDISCQRLSIENQTINHTSNEIAEIEISPNPTTKVVNINLTNGQLIYSLSVCTSSGQMVKKLENVNLNTYPLDLSDVKSGTYIVKMITSMGEYTKLIIKL